MGNLLDLKADFLSLEPLKVTSCCRWKSISLWHLVIGPQRKQLIYVVYLLPDRLSGTWRKSSSLSDFSPVLAESHFLPHFLSSLAMVWISPACQYHSSSIVCRISVGLHEEMDLLGHGGLHLKSKQMRTTTNQEKFELHTHFNFKMKETFCNLYPNASRLKGSYILGLFSSTHVKQKWSEMYAICHFLTYIDVFFSPSILYTFSTWHALGVGGVH